MTQVATLVTPKEVSSTTREWTIFPDGIGAFACGNPDGFPLRHGQELEVLLGDHWIWGTIEHHTHGSPRFIAQQTCCGLCAGMRVRLPE